MSKDSLTLKFRGDLVCDELPLEVVGGTGQSYDHIGNFNFRVEIDGVAAGHFTGVDGLSIEQE